MRIVSGKFKGKKLDHPIDKITRPLKDMTKESIFNLLLHSKNYSINFKKLKVLDLFSGSGSFGLECISRGSKNVYFFENYSEAIKILNKNIKILKDNQKFYIMEHNCFDYFNSNKNLDTKFDIIFIDPPYKELKINQLIENIIEKKILNNDGVIIVHRHKKDNIKITNKLKVFEERTYGISKIFFGN